MDIDLYDEEITQDFDYPHGNGGERLEIRYLTPEKMQNLTAARTKKKVQRGQVIPVTDDKGLLGDVLEAAVVAWHGFRSRGADAPLTRDNLLKLALKDYDFAVFVQEKCTSIGEFVQAGRDATEKNSASSSGSADSSQS